jgi:hypothetical protein
MTNSLPVMADALRSAEGDEVGNLFRLVRPTQQNAAGHFHEPFYQQLRSRFCLYPPFFESFSRQRSFR